MPDPDRTVRGNIRKRAIEACSFCRRRKIRCDADRPVCNNCRLHKRQCVYEKKDVDDEILRPRSRSSQQENDQGLATTNHNSSGRPISPVVKRKKPTSSKTSIVENSPSNDRSVLSRVLVADDGFSSYHGQTSALYEVQQNQRTTTSKRLPTEWVQKALLAEAALQRQMESINFAKDALDFDGVDPELGMHLLSLHWNRQHHSFLITYRPAFMRDMACNGPYFSKLLLNAIYFGSAKFSPRLEVRRDAADVRTAGWQFRQRVKELLGECLDKSEITTIQALLVMANSLFALGNERSAAWLYSGLAFRMIIDLGMHSEASMLGGAYELTDEDIEIRRRVFWGAFVVDKIQSLYHGRLPSLQADDASVPLEFLDMYEENEQWHPFAYATNGDLMKESYGPAFSVSTFSALSQLSVIMNSILNELYAERIMQSTANELSGILDKLQSSLDEWDKKLPAHLRFDPSSNDGLAPPHVLSLIAMYNVLLVLLHRPFVSDGHLFHHARSLSVNSLLTCVSAATNIASLLKAYHRAFSIQRAPYLISYATYVAATVHVRIAAQRTPRSSAHRNLAICLEVFSLNEGTNWAARRAKSIVLGLMQKLEVDVTGIDANLDFHDAASTKSIGQVAGSDAGFSPNFNIDAVIQSFAQDQIMRNDAQQNANAIQLQSQPRLMNVSQTQAQSQDQAQSQWPQTQEYQSYMTEEQPNDWMQWAFSAFPTDDVLYGFNGAATDGFYTQPY